MKIGKKIVLCFSGAILLLVIFLSGTVWFLYSHPDRIKALVEASLSDAIGASVTLSRLDYAISPFHVTAEGISVRPGDRLRGIYLNAPNFRADLSLTGRFGHKSLVVEHLEITDFSCRIMTDAKVSSSPEPEKGPSFFSNLIKRLVALLVFKDISFQEAALSHGNLNLQTEGHTLQATGIEAHLNRDHQIELSLSLSSKWPSRDMRLLIPSLLVKTEPAASLMNTEIKGRVSIPHATFENSFADLRDLRVETTFIFNHEQGAVKLEGLEAALPAANVKYNGKKDNIPLGLMLKGDGIANMKDTRLRIHPLKVVMRGALEYSGELDAVLDAERKISVDADNCRIVPRALLNLLPAEIKRRMDWMDLRGGVHLTGRMEGQEVKGDWSWDADVTARFKKNPVSLKTQSFQLSGDVTGKIHGLGRVPDVAISAALSGDQITASGAGIELKPCKADFTISGTYPAFNLKDLSVRIGQMNSTLKDKAVHLNDVRIEVGSGRINAATQALSLPEIQFTSAQLKNLKLVLEAGKGQRNIELSGKNTGILKWGDTLNLLPKAWTLSGGDILEGRGRFDAAHKGTFSCKLAFPQMAFQNREGTMLGDQVDISAAIQGKADLKTGIVSADAAIDATGGEALMDRFYVNLEKSPLSARAKGTYKIYNRHLAFSSFALRLAEIFTCNSTGKIFEMDGGWQVDLSTRIPETPLRPLFSFFIFDPFHLEKPFLKKVHVDGDVSAAIDLKGGRADWVAQGDVRWTEGTFCLEGKAVSLEGIDLSLPLWLSRRLSQHSPKGIKGRLYIRSMRLPFFPKQTMDFPLEACPNTLIVDTPTDVKVRGGNIRIDPIRIKDLIGTSPRLTAGLSMTEMNINPLLQGIWPKPVDGTMGGALVPIRLEGNRLAATGNITAKIFGGTVTVSNPRVSGLLTGAPVFRLNARWDGLNLQKLTAGTEFGEIEGVLKGYAEDLEFAQGQPQKFDLFLETVETNNVSQRISVKAVDNIARLGGGQSPFMGMAGTFASLFKEFPYEKIGVHATLENDVFTINGTIHEEGKEYLVKRGLFSGVNVVNQNTDNRVGFKDMIKRFKRVTSSKSGPVIK